MSGLVVGIMLMLKVSEDLRKVWNAFPCENAYFSNDAGNASRCKCTSGKAVDENFVPGDIVCCNELVTFPYDFSET